MVLGCVFGGYFEAGGQLVAIWQPAEMIIILGAGFGAMIVVIETCAERDCSSN